MEESTIGNVATGQGPGTTRTRVLDILSLTKLRLSFFMVFAMAATMYGAGGPDTPFLGLMAIMVGLTSSMGSSVANNIIDRDIDPLMERTAGRPLAAGRVDVPTASVLAALLSVGSFLLSFIFLPLVVSLMVVAGWFHYVVVYSILLKRRTVWNIVIGSWAGSYAPLVGWAMAAPLGWTPLLLAIVIVVWTPVHFWSLSIAHADQYRAAKIPMLPVVRELKKAARSILVATVVMIPLLAFIPFLPGPLEHAWLILLSLLPGIWTLSLSNSLLHAAPDDDHSKLSMRLYMAANATLKVLFLTTGLSALM